MFFSSSSFYLAKNYLGYSSQLIFKQRSFSSIKLLLCKNYLITHARITHRRHICRAYVWVGDNMNGRGVIWNQFQITSPVIWNRFQATEEIIWMGVIWNRYTGLPTLFNNRDDRNLGISRAPLKNQAHQGSSIFTSATTNQRVVRGKLRSNFQRVRGDKVAVKVGVV